jgi:type VI secretion system protein ImpM
VGAGFFGKLRSHGDFVTRRLPPAMQQPFDAWLQAGIVRSRADLGDAWLPTYLNSPLWRFVLAPGVCGPQAWAGVMMPSVDRVGRCFPLTLAAGLDAAPALHACMTVDASWFLKLEDLALSTLDDGFVLDAFDAALLALDGAPAASPRSGLAQAASCQVALLENGVLPPLVWGGIDGGSAWWTDGAELVAPCLVVGPGLPPAAGFAALLDGRHQA